MTLPLLRELSRNPCRLLLFSPRVPRSPKLLAPLLLAPLGLRSAHRPLQLSLFNTFRRTRRQQKGRRPLRSCPLSRRPCIRSFLTAFLIDGASSSLNVFHVPSTSCWPFIPRASTTPSASRRSAPLRTHVPNSPVHRSFSAAHFLQLPFSRCCYSLAAFHPQL
jgi:hypothetical protein